jgi:competence protein ComEC
VGCTPRWLKLDRPALAKTGGVAIAFASGRVTMVRGPGRHPWRNPPRVQSRSAPAD